VTTIANLLWLLLAGWWLALAYASAAVANAVTIIGIPFAFQSLKLAVYALWPFGRVVVEVPGKGGVSTIANVVWFLFGGVWLALAHLVAGVLLFVTIIGIPLAVVSFRMAGLALHPFGRMVVPVDEVAGRTVVIAAPRSDARVAP
jgi:uncharacterized membrane protein YccF (DUF307 family)